LFLRAKPRTKNKGRTDLFPCFCVQNLVQMKQGNSLVSNKGIPLFLRVKPRTRTCFHRFLPHTHINKKHDGANTRYTLLLQPISTETRTYIASCLLLNTKALLPQQTHRRVHCSLSVLNKNILCFLSLVRAKDLLPQQTHRVHCCAAMLFGGPRWACRSR
jgi:hypothetical protein